MRHDVDILVVVEIATVHNCRIQNFGISHDSVICPLRNHGCFAAILGIHCSSYEQGNYLVSGFRQPYSYKSVITCEKFFLVSLCRLEIAIRAARIA